MDVLPPMIVCSSPPPPPHRQRALAEVVQNTTRMGIAGSKEIRHLGWLAGKVGTRLLFCVMSSVSGDCIAYLYGVCVCLHGYEATFQEQ